MHIGDIGGLGLGPNMVVVTIFHDFHGYGLGMRGRFADEGGGQTSSYHQSVRGGNSPPQYAMFYKLFSYQTLKIVYINNVQQK
jgi:hypothetical protein